VPNPSKTPRKGAEQTRIQRIIAERMSFCSDRLGLGQDSLGRPVLENGPGRHRVAAVAAVNERIRIKPVGQNYRWTAALGAGVLHNHDLQVCYNTRSVPLRSSLALTPGSALDPQPHHSRAVRSILHRREQWLPGRALEVIVSPAPGSTIGPDRSVWAKSGRLFAQSETNSSSHCGCTAERAAGQLNIGGVVKDGARPV
jgi:hypothetical protein